MTTTTTETGTEPVALCPSSSVATGVRRAGEDGGIVNLVVLAYAAIFLLAEAFWRLSRPQRSCRVGEA